MNISTSFVALFLLAYSVAFFLLRRARRRAKLPPGPSAWPVIGNALQVPKTHLWLWLEKLYHQYGDLVYVDVLGRPMVILNTIELVQQVLRKPVASNRPHFKMACDMLELDRTVGLAPYAENWHIQRRLYAQHLNKTSLADNFSHLIHAEAITYVANLHAAPQEWWEAVRLTALRVIIRITYGREVKSLEDPYIIRNEGIVHMATGAVIPGAFAVDSLPILRYLPEWAAPYKQYAKYWKHKNQQVRTEGYQYVKDALARGDAPASFASKMIEDTTDANIDEETKQWACHFMYSSGETIFSFLRRFHLCMMLNPDVQGKAQEEIDRVVGTSRLPTFADKDSLPYLNAIYQEVLRWNTLTVIGIPRALREDHIINGYLIPKGTTVIPNNWAIACNPKIYPSPEKFQPERFFVSPQELKERGLDALQLDPRLYVFGSGRRACPGIACADVTVWTVMAVTLATTNILKPINPLSGKEHTVEIDPFKSFSNALIVQPKPFEIRVKPRNEGSLVLVQDALFGSGVGDTNGAH